MKSSIPIPVFPPTILKDRPSCWNLEIASNASLKVTAVTHCLPSLNATDFNEAGTALPDPERDGQSAQASSLNGT